METWGNSRCEHGETIHCFAVARRETGVFDALWRAMTAKASAMLGRALFVFVAALLIAGGPAHAVEPAIDGVKDIMLHTTDGKSVSIGTVTFTPEGDKSTFKIDFDDKMFAQYFLSMREFKCVEGPEILCHVPYPYANPRTVTAQDASWLEHALLFFYKRPADYGAKMAHGLLYTLTMTADGFVGRPQSIDLDEIATPPEDLSAAFFTGEHRYYIQPGARWFDSLTIAPHAVDPKQGASQK